MSFRPSSEPRAAFPVIDAHAHLGRWLSAWVDREGEWLVDDVAPWLDRMAEYGVHGFVNLDGRWGRELELNIERFDAAFPGRIATFGHIDWTVLRDLPAASLDHEFARQIDALADVGAAGVKVWKDLGLEQRDAAGHLVLPDDPRVEAVWRTAGERRLPVWWHVADPVAFFEPVDEANENFDILVERPEWSFHGGDYPSFARLMEAMEAVVSSHAETVFVAVHGGGHAEDPVWVSGMLDAYPNLHIDIAARLAQLGRWHRATRDLILRHPDRVLFGSDQIPPTGEEYPIGFRFLETDDADFAHTIDPDDVGLGRWAISGMGLPDEVLMAVYAVNAARILPILRLPK